MSAEYFWFTSSYALVLTVASLTVFTHRGRVLVLAAMRQLGHRSGLGAFGLLRTFGYRADPVARPAAERAALAESYIATAEAQTLVSARVTVWILISGFVFTALTGVAISAVLPRYVDSGALSYGAFEQVSAWLVGANVTGGLAMGIAVAGWLVVRTMRLNRSEGCAVTRDLVLAVQGPGLEPELRAEIASGAYPRLNGLISDVV